MNLGERILDLRKKAGMSQGALAEILNVSRQSISKWETNSSVPELDKLVKISEVFNISLDELVHGEERLARDEVPKTEKTVQMPRIETRKFLGLGLLGIGAVVFVLLSVLVDIFIGTTLAAPFLITGGIHLSVKKHPGLWSSWILYLLTDQFLVRFTSSSSVWGILQPGIYRYGVTFSLLVSWGMTLILGIIIFKTYRVIKASENEKIKKFIGAR